MGFCSNRSLGMNHSGSYFSCFRGVALTKELQSFRHVTSVGKRLRLGVFEHRKSSRCPRSGTEARHHIDIPACLTVNGNL